MNPQIPGQPDPPGVWPPAITPSEVWPPPPTQAPTAVVPFKTVFAYVEGSVPLFRAGTLAFGEGGVTIQGKAVPRYEIQVPVIAALFFLRIGWLIAYLVMEYGVRGDALLNVAWNQVRRVVLVPRKRRICLVYDAPNYKGVVKPFSLTTKLDPGAYDAYAAAASQHIPDRVAEGKLRAWTSPVVWTVCAGILISLVVLGILFAVDSYTRAGAGH